MSVANATRPVIDVERFRLRNVIDRLIEAGECDVHEAPIDLVDVAAILDGNAKAVLFRNAAGHELVGNVMGARKRFSLALDLPERDISREVKRRLAVPIPPVEIPSSEAPVQQVVRTGADVDLTALPVHLQHALDAAPYISASIDYALDPATGWTNIGCRRMMLRSATTAGVDLNAPSDLRAIYLNSVARGERLPVAYVVGSHPADFLAAMAGEPPTDELGLVGAVRGSAVPVVKCVTSDIRVPADAEYVIEGYFDERGLVEQEGPYGEFLGYYGAMKRNPVFHATAITSRRDALFQTVTISGSLISRTEAAVIGVVKTEASIWSILSQAVREPVAVCCTGSSGGMFNVRVAMNQRYPGEARNAIAALHASLGDVKNAFIVDADIDVFNDEQMDWAMATRFQGDRDLVVTSSFRTMPLDPSLDGKRTGSKVGFDLTKPFGSTALTMSVSYPPQPQVKPHRSVIDALKTGPRTFLELMEETGSRDGREIVRELGGLYERKALERDDDGRYVLLAP